jgi:glycosyltransferase involved in cell wall biosynthesis
VTREKRILYVQYTNPCGYPPLEHSSRILADGGWQVEFLGTGAHGANQLAFPPHANITVRLWRYRPPGWKQKLQYVWFVVWCIWWCLAWRPRVVYCSDLWSAPIGVLVWRLFKIPVVYHEHDTPAPPTNAILRFVHAMRWQIARVALACVIPQKERMERFINALKPQHAICVWNCPARHEVRLARAEAQSGRQILWYHGSLNGEQLPPTVIDALALLPSNVCFRFAGYETVGHVGFVNELLVRAERLGLRDRVEYLGTPPTRPALYALAAKADVGLALFARAFREPMTGASNKPFDYLACALALLATDTAEWREFYESAGCARVTNPDSAEAIAATVRGMLNDLTATHAMGDAGRQRVLDDWNYEKQFEPVKRLLEAL